jgi:hypothetical protein
MDRNPRVTARAAEVAMVAQMIVANAYLTG